MEKNDIIYFSVNNWFSGRDYPNTPKFKEWLGKDLNLSFRNDKWAKENKLCIYWGIIDMSVNFTIAAPKKWVEENCPELLSDEEYSYIVRRSCGYDKEKKKIIWENVKEKKKFSDFVWKPEDGEDEPDLDSYFMPFPEYKEENFGSEYYNTEYLDYEEDLEEETENDE